MRFIFVTGGVVSSLGKGIASASVATLLQSLGYKVRVRKLDPYLNVDPGTMSPYQHGEVFVTDDGAETDLDLGHYERFTGVSATKSDSVTSGRVYQKVIQKERRGDYLGATVQVIPHVTDMIKQSIVKDAGDCDFLIAEVGGTVGDIEGLPFLEALRQMRNDYGHDKVLFMHLTLLPFIDTSGELKTKPTQHSVKELLSQGIQADILLCRAKEVFDDNIKKKIALFCNVPLDHVIPAIDCESIYDVPLKLHEYGLSDVICKHFGLLTDKNVGGAMSMKQAQQASLTRWENVVNTVVKAPICTKIAVVGKYIHLQDCYKSIVEALTHGGIANQCKIDIDWVDSDDLSDGQVDQRLAGCQGVLVPGGFGSRGIKGKMRAIRYARENNIPFLGICYGMQLALIEYIRNVCGVEDVGSSEFGDFKHNVIDLMTAWTKDHKVQGANAGVNANASTQLSKKDDDGASIEEERIARDEASDKGGTMRLGAYAATVTKGSLMHSIYGTTTISERHRHRYEANIEYEDIINKHGMIFSAISKDGKLPEAIEIKDHPWFIGVQYHPELKSRPLDPHPLFASFVGAALAVETKETKGMNRVDEAHGARKKNGQKGATNSLKICTA